MDYLFRYRLQDKPAPTNDGSGMVLHSVMAVFLPENSPTNEEWKGAPQVPARNQTIVVPYTELKETMDMPHGNAAQKTAKNQAYKDMLEKNLNTGVEPLKGWSSETMELVLDNNDNSTLEAQRAHDYITVTLGQEYPVPFSI